MDHPSHSNPLVAFFPPLATGTDLAQALTMKDSIAAKKTMPVDVAKVRDQKVLMQTL